MHGEDNCVADALSCIPENTFPDENRNSSTLLTLHEAWKQHIGTVLSITTDQYVLESIKTGYLSDDFCLHLACNNVPSACLINDLWHIGVCLVIPRTGEIHKNLFSLIHDTLEHFRVNKSYTNLQDAYYWPNMQTWPKLPALTSDEQGCTHGCPELYPHFYPWETLPFWGVQVF